MVMVRAVPDNVFDGMLGGAAVWAFGRIYMACVVQEVACPASPCLDLLEKAAVLDVHGLYFGVRFGGVHSLWYGAICGG